jgi:hypothetical protein
MSGFPLLDVVIGLCFVYLLLALICTTLMEWIAQVLNSRGKMLVEATRRILGEPDTGPAPVTDAYFDHSLLKALTDGTRKPSYVASDVFTKALKEVITTRVQPSARLQESLKALAEQEPEGIDRHGLPANRAIAEWYDQFMDRVSGAYRRQTRLVVLLLSFGLTLTINADSIGLARNLWHNPTLRSYLVERAKLRLEQGEPLQTVEYTNPTDPQPSTPVPDSSKSPNRLLAEEQDLLGNLFGWSNEGATIARLGQEWRGTAPGWLVWLLAHLVGWAITGLAVSLGAPFWFDVLNRFVNLRSSGAAPAKAADKAAIPIAVQEKRA